MRISVDGNIASGKSTIARDLEDAYAVHLEPVKSWAPLLDRFYRNPASAAMPLQIRVLVDFCKVPNDDAIRVVERSPLACQHVFGMLAHQKGWLTDAQWGAFKDAAALLGWQPDAIVFIDTPVATCLQRMQTRAAEYSEPPTVSYLEDVRSKYETLLKFATIPVARIDGDRPKDAVLADVRAAVREFAQRRR